jgi:hypothetical protein
LILAAASSLLGRSSSSSQSGCDDTGSNLEEVSAVQRVSCGTDMFVISDVFAIVHLISLRNRVSAFLPSFSPKPCI